MQLRNSVRLQRHLCENSSITLEGGPGDGRRAEAPEYVDERIPFYFYTVKDGVTRHFFSLYDVYGVYTETLETDGPFAGEVLIEEKPPSI